MRIEQEENLSQFSHSHSHSPCFMFDFEKLEVYAKAKSFNRSIHSFLQNQRKVDKTSKDQLRRASFSIMLNIAEGSGRYTARDKRNFYIIARGSVHECVAILDYLKDIGQLGSEAFVQYYSFLEEISRMLFGIIKATSKT